MVYVLHANTWFHPCLCSVFTVVKQMDTKFLMDIVTFIIQVFQNFDVNIICFYYESNDLQ